MINNKRYLVVSVLMLVLLTSCAWPHVTPTIPFTGPLPTPTPKATKKPTPTSTVTNTPIPTATATQTPTPSPTSTPTSTPTPELPQELKDIAVNGKIIVIDLSEQKLWAYTTDSGIPVLETLVSTGTDRTPTPKGVFYIRTKLTATLMSGPGYYLPDVPYTMYFYKGYAIHGTYWHENFGHQMSHGCINLPTEMAQILFYWADPVIGKDQFSVNATKDNPGTAVYIHE